jgi:hypothetical protein
MASWSRRNDDHEPPHFHAVCSGQEASIAIETLGLLMGRLPPRALGLVTEWAAQHQDDLRRAWARAKNLEPPGAIEPLA